MRMLNGSSTPNTSLPTPQLLTGHCQSTRPAPDLLLLPPAQCGKLHQQRLRQQRIASGVEPVVSRVNATLTSDVVIKSPKYYAARGCRKLPRGSRENAHIQAVQSEQSLIATKRQRADSGGFSVLLHTSVPPARGSLWSRQRPGYRCVLRVATLPDAYFCTKSCHLCRFGKRDFINGFAAETTRGSVV